MRAVIVIDRDLVGRLERSNYNSLIFCFFPFSPCAMRMRVAVAIRRALACAKAAAAA